MPLARFTVTQLVLVPVFLAPGLAAVVGNRGDFARRAVVGVSAVLAVVMPVALGIYTFRTEGGLHDSLRPVSPTSTNPVAVMQVARFLKDEVAAKGGAAAIDDDPRYMDLQVAFFSGLPEMRMARVRWDTFRQRLQDARPDVLVRFDEGRLTKEPGVKLDGADADARRRGVPGAGRLLRAAARLPAPAVGGWRRSRRRRSGGAQAALKLPGRSRRSRCRSRRSWGGARPASPAG